MALFLLLPPQFANAYLLIFLHYFSVEKQRHTYHYVNQRKEASQFYEFQSLNRPKITGGKVLGNMYGLPLELLASFHKFF